MFGPVVPALKWPMSTHRYLRVGSNVANLKG